MINAVRSELLKMRSMPGIWVCFGLAFPLTALFVWAIFAQAGGTPGHTYLVRAHPQRPAPASRGRVLRHHSSWPRCSASSASPASTGTRPSPPPSSSSPAGPGSSAPRSSSRRGGAALMALLSPGRGGGTRPAVERRPGRASLPRSPASWGPWCPAWWSPPSCWGSSGWGSAPWSRTRWPAILLTIGGTFILEPILVAAGPGHLPLRPELAARRRPPHPWPARSPGRSRGQPRCDDALPAVVGRWPDHAGLGTGPARARLLHHRPPRRHLTSCVLTPRRATPCRGGPPTPPRWRHRPPGWARR